MVDVVVLSGRKVGWSKIEVWTIKSLTEPIECTEKDIKHCDLPLSGCRFYEPEALWVGGYLLCEKKETMLFSRIRSEKLVSEGLQAR